MPLPSLDTVTALRIDTRGLIESRSRSPQRSPSAFTPADAGHCHETPQAAVSFVRGEFKEAPEVARRPHADLVPELITRRSRRDAGVPARVRRYDAIAFCLTESPGKDRVHLLDRRH
ncbi:MAG: hypothetical protein M3P91_12055 [Actinomycetota bacterium]|nr:hypothetical protein [Actinomycetota bacterium]